MTSLYLALALAQGAPSAWDSSDWPPLPPRGRDVWALRSVMDGKPRMVTLNLTRDYWLTLDAATGAVGRFWKGSVKFDGSVYTASHGPQPTSEGPALALGGPERDKWIIRQPTGDLPLKPRYKGYTIEKGRIFFTFQFDLPGGGTGEVDQAVDYVEEGGMPGLFFAFRTRGFGYRLLPIKQLHLQGGEGVSTGSGASRQVEVPVQPSGSSIKLLFSPVRASLPSALEEGALAEPAQAGREQAPPLRSDREEGLSLRVYYFNREISQIPRLVEGQTPNFSKLIPQVNLLTDADFGGFSEKFMSVVSGYLNVARDGLYRFRLTSDDGSRFFLRDEKIIDHDGLHGPVPKEGSFTLSPGEHPILIEHFEIGGDNIIKLEWMPPGATQWSLVPPSAFSTVKGEVRVTAPGIKEIITEGEDRRPGDRRPLAGVHPAFDLVGLRPRGFQPKVGGIDFLPDGRMVVCNWEPDGGVYLLSGIEGSAHRVSVKRIAFGLAEPLGIKVVDGQIYVLQKQELTRLDDLDGDDVVDRYYAVANGWGVTSNFHEFAFGLEYEKGFFYGALATAIDPGGRSTQPQNPDRGRVIKIGKDGRYQFVAAGLRTPNGIGRGPGGRIYITDNQGDWLPSSKVLLLKEGAFYGNRSVDPVGTKSLTDFPPVLWLPQNEIGNSPSQTARLNLGPYKDQLLHGDVTHGGVKRSSLETVKGVLQGAVFRFTQGLEAGVNRIAWGPDGALYVGGIGSTGNWGQEGKERFGLEKLAWNGKVPFEILTMSSRSNGFELTFTKPLAPGQDLARLASVSDWKYVPTAEYGGDKVEPRSLPVKSATVSRDRTRVFLEIPGLQKGRVVYVHLDPLLRSQGDEMLWSTEAWYTLNEISNRAGAPSQPQPRRMAGLTIEEEKAGWKPLFNERNLEGWTKMGSSGEPAGGAWSAAGIELALTPGLPGGDIIAPGTYGDFDLKLEWKVAPKGNSGIFYRVDDSVGTAWHTGPEYQILDNPGHPDGRSPLTAAGANYALQPTRLDVCRPAGEWNEARIIVEKNRVRHYLNGFLTAEYVLGSAEWKEMVARSKFSGLPKFGQASRGRIVLQDHGYRTSFRNIRIKSLD